MGLLTVKLTFTVRFVSMFHGGIVWEVLLNLLGRAPHVRFYLRLGGMYVL
jgi:hypothetical protein